MAQWTNLGTLRKRNREGNMMALPFPDYCNQSKAKREIRHPRTEGEWAGLSFLWHKLLINIWRHDSVLNNNGNKENNASINKSEQPVLWYEMQTHVRDTRMTVKVSVLLTLVSIALIFYPISFFFKPSSSNIVYKAQKYW